MRTAPTIDPSYGTLAIDPGFSARTRGCACVASRGGELALAWFARPDVTRHPLPFDVSVVIVEKPQLDGRSADKIATILELGWQGALLAGLYAGEYGALIDERTPTQWKGSEAKPKAHARMWGVLTEFERAMLGGPATWREIDAACTRGGLERWRPGVNYYARGFVMHNILDAAQLNLTQSGRMR